MSLHIEQYTCKLKLYKIVRSCASQVISKTFVSYRQGIQVYELVYDHSMVYLDFFYQEL